MNYECPFVYDCIGNCEECIKKRLETLLKNGKVDLEGMDELLKYTLELDKVFVRLKQTQDLGRKITEK